MNLNLEAGTMNRKLINNSEEKKDPNRPSKNNQKLIEEMSGMTIDEKKTFARDFHKKYEEISKEKTLSFMKFCIALSETSKDLKYGEKEAWYLSDFHLKKREAQKRTQVAEKLARFKSVHLNVFSPSQLIRIAAIKNDDAISIIITNKIKLTSESLEKLNANFETVIGSEEDAEQIKLKIESFYKSYGDQTDPDENGESKNLDSKENSNSDTKDKTSDKKKINTNLSKTQMLVTKCTEVKDLTKKLADGISYVDGNIADSHGLISHLNTLLDECKEITKTASGAIKKIEAATKISKGGKSGN